MWRAAQWILRCRTSALGGHIVRCPQGHQRHIAYNSCRHRSCPQCAALPREKWLVGWAQRLLDCPHHHVVFTVPHELNKIWLYNKKTFAGVLFAAASGALQKLLRDTTYLGAQPGLLAALHTWSQSLATHVHLHVLVTAGGLDRLTQQWRQCVKDCLLPRKVLMIIFRGKLRHELLELLRQGELTLPPDMSESQLRGLLNKLGRTVWNVKILERYNHGHGVAKYLARYLKGGPLSSRRLVSHDRHHVRFRARSTSSESVDGRVKLSIQEFFLRFLRHVPPHGMQVVRGYGLYAGCNRARLNTARRLMGQQGYNAQSKRTASWQELSTVLGNRSATLCATCGATLVVVQPNHRGRAPPMGSLN